MFFGERLDRFIATTSTIETELGPGRKQYGGGDAESFLVIDQLFIGAAGVVGVLMDVDNEFLLRVVLFLGGGKLRCGEGGCGCLKETSA